MIIPVLAAIIRDERNRLLIAKRKPGLTREGYWEFPGGKLQSGETPEEGIQREILEELGMKIVVGEAAGVVTHKYPDVEIVLIAFHCRSQDCPGLLKDHDELSWVSVENLANFSFSEADKKLIALLYLKSV